MCFLPQDAKARDFAVRRFAHFIKVEGQTLLGWRDVPTDTTGLGKTVLEQMPVIRQAIVGRGARVKDQDAFERKLLTIRKQTQNPLAELAVKHRLPGLTQLYMPSFSTRTVVYKGLLLAPQVEGFYCDLRDPLTQSALALESSLSAYQTGSVDFESLLTNFSSVLEFEVNYYEELANYQKAIVNLEQITGLELVK